MRDPSWLYPDGAERDYLRAILKALNPWVSELKAEILNSFDTITFDAALDDWIAVNSAINKRNNLDSVFDNAINKWTSLSKALNKSTEKAFAQVDSAVKVNLTKQIEAVENNKRMPTIKMRYGILPPDAVKGLDAELQMFTRQNSQLLKSLGDDVARSIESKVQDALRKGTTRGELGRIIAKEHNICKKRAALIARDQIGKINGQISMVRMKQAGIIEYKWRTRQDKRVRDSHRALNGKIRSWDESPIPGEEIRCRCVALPHITKREFGL